MVFAPGHNEYRNASDYDMWEFHINEHVLADTTKHTRDGRGWRKRVLAGAG